MGTPEFAAVDPRRKLIAAGHPGQGRLFRSRRARRRRAATSRCKPRPCKRSPSNAALRCAARRACATPAPRPSSPRLGARRRGRRRIWADPADAGDPRRAAAPAASMSMPSLLPRWRGAAPIQRSILAGDRESGITIMQMDEVASTPARSCWSSSVCRSASATTAGALHRGATSSPQLGGELIVEALGRLTASELTPASRDRCRRHPAAKKLSRDEGAARLARPTATAGARKSGAFDPSPGAQFPCRRRAHPACSVGRGRGQEHTGTERRPAPCSTTRLSTSPAGDGALRPDMPRCSAPGRGATDDRRAAARLRDPVRGDAAVPRYRLDARI